MFASNASEEAAARKPDWDTLLDCLVQLDGRIRLIVDRDGGIVARPRRAALPLGSLLGASHVTSTARCEKGARIAGPRALAERLLAVRGEETEVVLLGREDGGAPVVARACAIDERHVCILFIAPCDERPGRIDELGALFGLTACEAQVVLDLFHGRSPQAIADRRGNSIHTIRAHIRQCHQKIGAKTREEMLSRIAGICA
ncbi:helix-turn-helix transcriptional regulator [Erythrobacter sp.]|uniref:helix-turn-helix transcriptional regulator n=1 Tax=Erythrobacter sp. TaxID=1042 RepID=UPI001425ECF3|nr:helix-turn-helix transcriptional regulator [Erythrobacter sp.]QIQ85683.1 MAG: hypothetical protein G9473_02520 [Erythrobacter sp.]